MSELPRAILSAEDIAKLSDEELAKLEAERGRLLNQAVQRGKFAMWRPLPHQLPWFQSKKPIIVVIGGNRIGKSTAGSIKVTSEAIGTFPPSLGGTIPQSWDHLDRKGHMYLVVAENFSTVIAKTIIPTLKQYLTDEMQSRRPKLHPATRTPDVIYLRSGAEIHIMSYEQAPESFEGAAWNGAWCDEQAPQPIFNAIRRGTIDKKGWIWITGTPLREPYMHDMFVIRSQDPDDDMSKFVDCFSPGIHMNCRECTGGVGYLEHDWIMGWLNSLPTEERAARERGEFLDLTGRVFPYISDSHHVVPDLW